MAVVRPSPVAITIRSPAALKVAKASGVQALMGSDTAKRPINVPSTARCITLAPSTRKASAGHTIVLTTHYLEEAEMLCNRIAMLKAGRIVALDTTHNLLRRFSSHTLRLRAEGSVPAGLLHGATESGGWWSLPFDRYEEVELLLARIREAGCGIEDLEIGKPDLEEVFVRVMQGESKGGGG